MIQSLKYYYDINITKIEKDNEALFFKINNNLFYFVPFRREKNDLQDIVAISKELKNSQLKFHDIIINKFNNILTPYNNELYVLIMMRTDFKQEVDLVDMFNNINAVKINDRKSRIYSNNWKMLWQNKLDYYEKKVKDIPKSNEMVLNMFLYFDGLSEMAIQYLEFTNQKYSIGPTDKITFCHRRIFFPNLKLNYYNPLSLIIDVDVRDYAEYFKAAFYYGENIYAQFKSFIKTIKFSNYSCNLFFARLLFPTYFFDAFEQILNGEIVENKMINIFNNFKEYMSFLNFAFSELKSNYKLFEIKWIYE